MILLEGVDRTGKTSVAEALVKLLPGWSFSHQTKPSCHAFSYFGQRLVNAHPRVVMDRGHWSNYVYGRVYDGSQALLTPHQWRVIELALLSRATTVLYLHDEPDAIRARWGEEEMYPADQVYQLLNLYHVLATSEGADDFASHIPRISRKMDELIDLATGEPTADLVRIANTAAWEANWATRFPAPSQGVGSLAVSGFMVVGEAPPNRCEPCGDLPRVPLDIGPAAGWLWRALDELDVRWWEGYYTNASSFAGPEHFAQVANLLDPRVVLTLGNPARNLALRAETCGLNLRQRVINVQHPMYVRRFQHRDFEPWRTEIGRALVDFCQADADYLPEIDAEMWGAG